ncbi:hypothetical protein [Peptoniphilus asaccharolyticus]
MYISDLAEFMLGATKTVASNVSYNVVEEASDSTMGKLISGAIIIGSMYLGYKLSYNEEE